MRWCTVAGCARPEYARGECKLHYERMSRTGTYASTRRRGPMSDNPCEIAWAAGFFEGEGCIFRSKSGTRIQRCLIVNNTDRDVLDRFDRIVGVGKIVTPKRHRTAKAHWKQIYEWRVNDWESIVRILDTFWPYLGERRRATALDLFDHAPRHPNDPRKTHCKRGHPLRGPDADVYVNPARPNQLLCNRCRDDRREAARLDASGSDPLFDLPDPVAGRALRSASRPPTVRRLAGECSACAAGHCRSCHGFGCSHECDIGDLL